MTLVFGLLRTLHEPIEQPRLDGGVGQPVAGPDMNTRVNGSDYVVDKEAEQPRVGAK